MRRLRYLQALILSGSWRVVHPLETAHGAVGARARDGLGGGDEAVDALPILPGRRRARRRTVPRGSGRRRAVTSAGEHDKAQIGGGCSGETDPADPAISFDAESEYSYPGFDYSAITF